MLNTVYMLIFASTHFCELLEMHSGNFFGGFFPRGSRRSNLPFFYLAHILCTCTRQYEYDDVLDGFWGPGDGCRSDTGSETVPGPIFASSNFCGLGFICEYNENLYTAKISMYTVCIQA